MYPKYWREVKRGIPTDKVDRYPRTKQGTRPLSLERGTYPDHPPPARRERVEVFLETTDAI